MRGDLSPPGFFKGDGEQARAMNMLEDWGRKGEGAGISRAMLLVFAPSSLSFSKPLWRRERCFLE